MYYLTAGLKMAITKQTLLQSGLSEQSKIFH